MNNNTSKPLLKLNTTFNQGFTLVEVMVSLLLGTLLIAAAGQLLITSQLGFAIQQASSEIQDSGNFGVQALVSDIRKSNYGASQARVGSDVLYGGIVLTAKNFPAPIKFEQKFATNRSGGNGYTGLSNLNVGSDQLTIQYKPFYKELENEANTVVIGTDCEGRNITLGEAKDNVVIVQRYFLRKDSKISDSEIPEPLALACAADRYDNTTLNGKAAGAVELTRLKGNGEIVIRRVDYFDVRFLSAQGTYNNPTAMSYGSATNANTIGESRRILSVQIGLVVRASEPLKASDELFSTPSFDVLNRSDLVLAKADSSASRYLRNVIVQTVALRNGFGD